MTPTTPRAPVGRFNARAPYRPRSGRFDETDRTILYDRIYRVLESADYPLTMAQIRELVPGYAAAVYRLEILDGIALGHFARVAPVRGNGGTAYRYVLTEEARHGFDELRRELEGDFGPDLDVEVAADLPDIV